MVEAKTVVLFDVVFHSKGNFKAIISGGKSEVKENFYTSLEG